VGETRLARRAGTGRVEWQSRVADEAVRSDQAQVQLALRSERVERWLNPSRVLVVVLVSLSLSSLR